MSIASDRAYWVAKLAELELRITAWETALDEFAADGAQQSYTLDTGQDEIRVERVNLATMQRAIDRMYSRRDMMRARAGLCSPGYHGRPTW